MSQLGWEANAAGPDRDPVRLAGDREDRPRRVPAGVTALDHGLDPNRRRLIHAAAS